MPWLEIDVRDQRIQFVLAASRSDANLMVACRAFGISRKTGCKWLDRREAAGSSPRSPIDRGGPMAVRSAQPRRRRRA
jgi:putative transposase